MTKQVKVNPVLNPVTPLGYVNGDYAPLTAVQTGGQSGALVTCDAAIVSGILGGLSWSGSVANHADTVRASVTIPSGARAILTSIFFFVAQPASGKELRLRVRVGGYTVCGLYVVNADSSGADRRLSVYPNMIVPEGSTIEIISYSTDTTAREFNSTLTYIVYAVG